MSAEKLPSGREALQGLRKLEEISGRRVDAVLPVEIGGSNGLAALLLALRAGLAGRGLRRHGPRVSRIADGHLQHPRTAERRPAVLTDDKGNCVVLETIDNVTEERTGARGVGGAGRLLPSRRILRDSACR